MSDWLRHLWGALRLDEDSLYKIGIDRRFNAPAVLLFSLAALLAGLGWQSRFGTSLVSWPAGWAAWLAACLSGWAVFIEGVRFSGQFIFSGAYRADEIRRLSGFAAPPLALSVLSAIGSLPLGLAGGLLGWAWALAILFAGLRASFGDSPRRILGLLFFGLAPGLVAWGLVYTFLVTALSFWLSG